TTPTPVQGALSRLPASRGGTAEGSSNDPIIALRSSVSPSTTFSTVTGTLYSIFGGGGAGSRVGGGGRTAWLGRAWVAQNWAPRLSRTTAWLMRAFRARSDLMLAREARRIARRCSTLAWRNAVLPAGQPLIRFW